MLTQLGLITEKIKGNTVLLGVQTLVTQSVFMGPFQPDCRGLYVAYIQESTQEQVMV